MTLKTVGVKHGIPLGLHFSLFINIREVNLHER